MSFREKSLLFIILLLFLEIFIILLKLKSPDITPKLYQATAKAGA